MADYVRVVNIIPNSQSGETNQDSEPNLAVNPENPQEMAATAFTPNPMGGANSPIFYSNDGGTTWSMLEIIAGTPVRDQTLRFATQGGHLYAGVLWGSSGSISLINYDILRTNDFTGATTMTRLATRTNDDQPFVQAATVPSGPAAGEDRVYIGSNDHAPAHVPSTIDFIDDAAAGAATITTMRLEARAVVRDGFQTRPAVHTDGTVYAIFYAWITGAASSDVVIVRDDNWATGASPFTALVDGGDGLQGVRIVTGVNNPGLSLTLAQQRIGGDLSIAVDPRNSSVVYVCWGDLQSGTYTLHVRRSVDRGVTWSADLYTLTNATNPALAVNSVGRVGLVYQQVTGSVPNQRWKTIIDLTTNNFASIVSHVLADTPASTPVSVFSPYIGDYIYLMAVGRTFYGIFSANNTPDSANFPSGVTYQRAANWTTKVLQDTMGHAVAVSIDPFFFSVTASKFRKELKPEFEKLWLHDKPHKFDLPEKLQLPLEWPKFRDKIEENWQEWLEREVEIVRQMAVRIDDLEQQIAGRAFIQPEERPQLAQSSAVHEEAESTTPARKTARRSKRAAKKRRE